MLSSRGDRRHRRFAGCSDNRMSRWGRPSVRPKGSDWCQTILPASARSVPSTSSAVARLKKQALAVEGPFDRQALDHGQCLRVDRRQPEQGDALVKPLLPHDQHLELQAVFCGRADAALCQVPRRSASCGLFGFCQSHGVGEEKCTRDTRRGRSSRRLPNPTRIAGRSRAFPQCAGCVPVRRKRGEVP